MIVCKYVKIFTHRGLHPIHSYVTSNSERYLRYIANVSISRQRHWRKTEAYLTSGKGSLWKRWKEYFHFQSIFLHCLVGFWIYLKPGGTPWRFWWRSLEKSNLKVCSLCPKKKMPNIWQNIRLKHISKFNSIFKMSKTALHRLFGNIFGRFNDIFTAFTTITIMVPVHILYGPNTALIIFEHLYRRIRFDMSKRRLKVL